MDQPRLPVRRFLVEGVVIVLSILLAFGIDASWDEFQESRKRSALIAGLTSDFEASREELAAAMVEGDALVTGFGGRSRRGRVVGRGLLFGGWRGQQASEFRLEKPFRVTGPGNRPVGFLADRPAVGAVAVFDPHPRPRTQIGFEALQEVIEESPLPIHVLGHVVVAPLLVAVDVQPLLFVYTESMHFTYPKDASSFA